MVSIGCFLGNAPLFFVMVWGVFQGRTRFIKDDC